jgi:hypothetical protein
LLWVRKKSNQRTLTLFNSLFQVKRFQFDDHRIAE